jgi:hypothetical protein
MKRFLIIILTLVSCDNDLVKPLESNSEYVVFGHFFGFCAGEECVEIFKLTENHLFEDSKDAYPSYEKSYQGDFHLLNDATFQKVKGLKDLIPQQLLTTNETVVGQPDAGDWGGIYFEVRVNGEKKFWLIDKMEMNLPDYLKPFVSEIENRIDLINN